MERPYNSVTIRMQCSFEFTNSILNHIISKYHMMYDYVDDANTYRVLVFYGRVKHRIHTEQVCIHARKTEQGTELNVHSIPSIEGYFEVRQYRRSSLLETIVRSFPNADCEKCYLSDSQMKKDRKSFLKLIAIIVVSLLCVRLILYLANSM